MKIENLFGEIEENKFRFRRFRNRERFKFRRGQEKSRKTLSYFICSTENPFKS